MHVLIHAQTPVLPYTCETTHASSHLSLCPSPFVPSQVRDLELIPEDASEYKATEMRPVNTYSQTGQATQRFQYCDSKGCVK